MSTGHIGLRPFLAQRQRLLAEFDSLTMEGLDDAVKATHGLGAEAVYRDWLEGFLPKRFAVTKDYIITPNEQGNPDLQEWDVLIYDQLASPVLFTRSFDGTKRRAIPVEYVRHVMEVIAQNSSIETLNQVATGNFWRFFNTSTACCNIFSNAFSRPIFSISKYFAAAV